MAAAVWAGGLVFLGVAAGVARRTVPERERIDFFRGLGRRFVIAAGVAALLLALTGIHMARDELDGWSEFWHTHFGHILIWKTALFAAIVIEATLHSFVLGPRVARIRERVLATPEDTALQAQLRRNAALSGSLSLLMLAQTALILVLAADLVA